MDKCMKVSWEVDNDFSSSSPSSKCHWIHSCMYIMLCAVLSCVWGWAMVVRQSKRVGAREGDLQNIIEDVSCSVPSPCLDGLFGLACHATGLSFVPPMSELESREAPPIRAKSFVASDRAFERGAADQLEWKRNGEWRGERRLNAPRSPLLPASGTSKSRENLRPSGTFPAQELDHWEIWISLRVFSSNCF